MSEIELIKKPEKFKITLGEKELFSIDVLKLECKIESKTKNDLFGDCVRVNGVIIKDRINLNIYASN